jgi:hypothetical protein
MDDGTDTTLSPDVVIRSGGWDPRYARVLLIERTGDKALVLVDGNGDGAELELEYWRRDAADGWQGETSSGHSALDSLDAAETWSTGEYVSALGRVSPGSVVSIAYGGNTYRRHASELGVWGFIHPTDSSRAGELPAVATNGG